MHAGIHAAILPDSYYCSFVSGMWRGELRHGEDYLANSVLVVRARHYSQCLVRRGRPAGHVYCCTTRRELSRIRTRHAGGRY